MKHTNKKGTKNKAERLKNKESTKLNAATVKSIIEEANENNNSKYYSELTDISIITKQGNLKSIYENGGFWIGRYEVGAETAITTNDNSARTPIIKQNSYPYNYVTCSQAQTLSKQLATGGKTSSLMFGIQWNLVLKFMEEKGYLSDGTTKVTQSMLKSDSGDWGNYENKSFSITNENAKGTTTVTTANSWNTVTEKTAGNMLLTTGATERNSILNIYDLAGNIYEWTLEYTTGTNLPCVGR